MCQDTGTAIVMGKKGQQVWTGGDDAAALSAGIRRTYTETNLRYSQVAPLSMYEEVNTGDNLPAQIDLYAEPGDQYKFLFIAKGGGSANKSFLYQQTKAVLNPKSLLKFLDEKIRTLGTAACPPYHLAIVIGGTSAEMNLKTVKLASCRYLDSAADGRQPIRPGLSRPRISRQEVLELTRGLGIGAQFGGKYFCHDVRVIRLPRHGASLPIGIGVSCSADRQILGKITADGVFLEELETNPARFLPEIDDATLGGEVVAIDLVAADGRDPPHAVAISDQDAAQPDRPADRRARHRARQTAGAARSRRRAAAITSRTTRSITRARPRRRRAMPRARSGRPRPGAWTAMSMPFMAAGGSFVTLAKGNRGPEVRDACKKHGGFYLGSIGGPAARLAQDCIRKVEVLEYPELGMEAIWRIEVVDFPAFIVIDDKGNDFFAALT